MGPSWIWGGGVDICGFTNLTNRLPKLCGVCAIGWNISVEHILLNWSLVLTMISSFAVLELSSISLRSFPETHMNSSTCLPKYLPLTLPFSFPTLEFSLLFDILGKNRRIACGSINDFGDLFVFYHCVMPGECGIFKLHFR